MAEENTNWFLNLIGLGGDSKQEAAPGAVPYQQPAVETRGLLSSDYDDADPAQNDRLTERGTLRTSYEQLFETDAAARMMLGGIALGAKGILDWQSQRLSEESKLKQIDRQYENQQQAIDTDIKRRSSRAKIRNSVTPQPVLGIRG